MCCECMSVTCGGKEHGSVVEDNVIVLGQCEVWWEIVCSVSVNLRCSLRGHEVCL